MMRLPARAAACCAWLVIAAPLAFTPPAAAQTADPGLGTAQWSYLHMLLQKTFLKVDVVTIDVCFDEATARRFGTFASRPRLSAAAADSITRAALETQRALGRVQFVRNVSLDEFLDGVDEDLRQAVRARVLPDSVHRNIMASLPGAYAFLKQRGIRKGDQLVYDIEPQTIRTRWISADGRTMFDVNETGQDRRTSPLATWFAPGSVFRNDLLRSLQREGARAAREPFAERCRPRTS